jgi:Phage integrase family
MPVLGRPDPDSVIRSQGVSVEDPGKSLLSGSFVRVRSKAKNSFLQPGLKVLHRGPYGDRSNPVANCLFQATSIPALTNGRGVFVTGVRAYNSWLARADFTLFAWLCGMRKSEIASLRWEDVDGDCIRLRAENAKNGKSRALPLEGDLAELIARHRVARQFKTNGTVTLWEPIFHRKGRTDPRISQGMGYRL